MHPGYDLEYSFFLVFGLGCQPFCSICSSMFTTDWAYGPYGWRGLRDVATTYLTAGLSNNMTIRLWSLSKRYVKCFAKRPCLNLLERPSSVPLAWYGVGHKLGTGYVPCPKEWERETLICQIQVDTDLARVGQLAKNQCRWESIYVWCHILCFFFTRPYCLYHSSLSKMTWLQMEECGGLSMLWHSEILYIEICKGEAVSFCFRIFSMSQFSKTISLHTQKEQGKCFWLGASCYS